MLTQRDREFLIDIGWVILRWTGGAGEVAMAELDGVLLRYNEREEAERGESYKLCPFCGGKPVSSHTFTPEGVKNYFFCCQSCAAEAGWSRDELGAKRLWNLRQQD